MFLRTKKTYVKSTFMVSFLVLFISCNGGSGSGTSTTLVSCPSNFILVPHNSNVGTQSDFCVMKYEAKNNGSGSAVSQAAGNPYVNISSTDAKTRCTNLGANYDLISNQEWMTIARNAESVASNFSSGVMARGWSATSSGDGWANTGVAPSTGSSCLYNTGANTCSSTGSNLYKRTLALTNGEEIWDFSGNVWERVDWSHTASGLQLGPTSCDPSIVEFPDVLGDSCFNNGDLLDQDVFPVTTNGSSSEGFGQFAGGTGGAAIRGGNWFNGSEAGAFSLNLGGNTTYTSGSVGFRCVYRL